MNKITSSVKKVAMTSVEVEQCKDAIREGNRGFNVQPNSYDVAVPFRVAINFNDEWHNYGNFSSIDVAAAVGSIVSSAFFGESGKAGEYNEEVVATHKEFTDWVADTRNSDIIAKAEGDQPCVRDGGTVEKKAKEEKSYDKDAPNPFLTEDKPF